MSEKEREAAIKEFVQMPDIDRETAEIIYDSGITSMKKLKEMDLVEMAGIEALGFAGARKVYDAVLKTHSMEDDKVALIEELKTEKTEESSETPETAPVVAEVEEEPQPPTEATEQPEMGEGEEVKETEEEPPTESEEKIETQEHQEKKKVKESAFGAFGSMLKKTKSAINTIVKSPAQIKKGEKGSEPSAEVTVTVDEEETVKGEEVAVVAAGDKIEEGEIPPEGELEQEKEGAEETKKADVIKRFSSIPGITKEDAEKLYGFGYRSVPEIVKDVIRLRE